MKKLLFIPAIASLALSRSVFAGEGQTNILDMKSVSVIAKEFGGHKAGNIEVWIENGLQLPPGVSCDRNYITTLKANDVNGEMLSSLRAAKIANHKVRFWITDNQAYNAYSGRCSFLSVEVF